MISAVPCGMRLTLLSYCIGLLLFISQGDATAQHHVASGHAMNRVDVSVVDEIRVEEGQVDVGQVETQRSGNGHHTSTSSHEFLTNGACENDDCTNCIGSSRHRHGEECGSCFESKPSSSASVIPVLRRDAPRFVLSTESNGVEVSGHSLKDPDPPPSRASSSAGSAAFSVLRL